MKAFTQINVLRGLAVAGLALALSACATKPPPCGSPTTKNLDDAVVFVQQSLKSGCAVHFDRFYDDLLTIAEGDPKSENNVIELNRHLVEDFIERIEAWKKKIGFDEPIAVS